ncbi:replication/maintenance protein RepL [Campylobacter upsaliensis]|nr:replication/maintenance protein RepL [Campylobacter upsaliensis]
MTNQIQIQNENIHQNLYKNENKTKQELKYKKTKRKIKEKKEVGITTEVIGTETYYRKLENGTLEPVEVELIQKKVSHTLKGGWRRVYMENFMELVTGIYGNMKQLEVVDFILSNLNSDNQFVYTQTQISEKTKISFPTINKIFQYLIDSDFMRKKGAIYIVNPKYVCAFGSDKKNQKILIEYSESKEPTLFDDLE